MPDRIPIVISFRLRPDLVEQIEAVDPRIETRMVPQLGNRQTGDLPPEEHEAALAALADARILFGPNAIQNRYLDAAPALEWFQIINAGVDHMFELGQLQRGFTVTTASGLAAAPIAEWVMGALLMLCKDMPRHFRDQQARTWTYHFCPELRGKTIGIVGMGAIGRETARRARAFDMRVIATRRTVPAGAADPDCDLLLPYDQLDTLLAESDYVVLCVPLTPETTGLIGAAELAKMKPTASIVNIARGKVIDQPALIRALQDGTIAAAALDVTDPEPLPSENELWGLENVLITPHISGAVEGYGTKAAQIFLRNLPRYLRGEELENVVDPVLAY